MILEKFIWTICPNLHHFFYQYNDALLQNAHVINNSLREVFCDQWRANNGSLLWPSRSPDLTDCFSWGTLKNVVYNTQLTNKEICKKKVTKRNRNLRPKSKIRAIDE